MNNVGQVSASAIPGGFKVQGLEDGGAPERQPDREAASPNGAKPRAAGDERRPPITERMRGQAAALRNALAFTQIVGLLTRSPHYAKYTLADIHWLVVPPLIAGQFRIGEAAAADGKGPTLPVAVVLWACVSEEVDRRLMAAQDSALQLKPEDWTSGTIPWLVHAAGETRFVRHVVGQLAETTFKGRQLKVFGVDQDGNPKIHVLGPGKDTGGAAGPE